MQVIRRLTVKTETWRGGDEQSVCGKEGGVEGRGGEKRKWKWWRACERMTGSAPTCCLTKSHISDTVRMKIFFCFSLQAWNELTPIVGKAVSHCHKLHICWDCWLGLYFSGSIHFTLFKKLLFLNQFCNGFPFFISMPNNKYILTLAGEHLAYFLLYLSLIIVVY